MSLARAADVAKFSLIVLSNIIIEIAEGGWTMDDKILSG